MFEVLRGCNVIGYGIFGSMASNSEPPQPPNYDNIEMEGIGSLTLPNSLKAPIERLELSGNSVQGYMIKVLPTELEQGTLNASNGQNFPSDYRVRTKDFISVEKGLYKITCEGAIQGNLVEYEENGTYKKTQFIAHTLLPWVVEFTEKCKVRITVSNGTEADKILIKPSDVKSITLQTKATPETPQEIVSAGKYDETSGKYVIDVSVTGKNLINEEHFFDLRNWTKNLYPVQLVPNAKYTFSRRDNSGYKSGMFLSIKKTVEGSFSQVINTNSELSCKQKVTFTTNETGLIEFQIQNVNNINFKDMLGYAQLEKSDVPTPYEPYHEPQTLTIPLDRPLTKWDKIEKRDGVYGIVCKHRTVDDLATLVKDSEPIYGNPGERYFSVPVKDATLNYDYSKAYSECGLYKKEVQRLYVPRLMLSSFIIYVNDTDTIETAKEHLHYKVIYETDSEEFVPLSEETQLALENLHANDGTTIITVDSGEVETGIKLTYRKEK